MEIEKTQYKDNFKHICKNCNFYSNNKNDFNRHISTAKHKKRVFGNKNEFLEIKKLICECCSKEYKTKSGLWKHHKACNKNIIIHNIKNNNLENLVVKLITDNNDIKNTLLKENQELKKKLDEKDNQINELIPKIGNTTTNNTINNKFNINVFLNEQCKDAMSINEFVKSIEVSLKNLLTTKTKGLGIGINDIINENMNKLSIYKRPIHCTDKKRETLYVKHDNWEKDIDKTYTTNMLKGLQLQQIKSLHLWKEAHPNYMENEELKHEYMILVNKCTKPLSDHEKKIFRNICESTYIKDDKLLDE
tara:strand:+ start:520 stop:1434 length:915 start_codon:yes stop_codon:yes gene_type:complete